MSRLGHDLLRLTWVVVTLLALGLFITGIPGRYDRLLQVAAQNEQVLQDLGLAATFYAGYFIALDLILVLTHFAVAALIFWRRSDNLIAVLVAITLVTMPVAAIGAFEANTMAWQLAADLLLYIGLTSSIILLYLFPDGRFIPGWTRPMALLWILLNIPAVFFPEAPLSFSTWPRLFQLLALVAWAGTAVYAQIHRYLGVSNPIQRQQTKWASFGLVAAVLGPLGYYLNILTLPSITQASPPALFYNLADPAVFRFATGVQMVGLTIYTLILLLFPLSFGFAIFRHHLFDIEIVFNRTLVYGSLTALIVGLYALIVVGISAIFQTQVSFGLALLATGLVALLVQPLQSRLQRAVNRLMYGDRDDPEAVLIQMGQRLEETVSPEATLPAIVETISQSLRLPYTAIALQKGESLSIAASVGSERGEPQQFPLVYHAETIGALIVTPRAAGESLTSSEQKLLRYIAQQAGTAVHAARLTADLQRSRQQLVTAREEERRRLRRDLHDGLGPRLATLTLRVDTARNLLAKDPQGVDALLLELKGQVQETIADIRNLVHDLRPPALDQLGLVSALREQANAQNGFEGLQIKVDGPEPMPSLPAAVEVAAYRIATEAVTNVVRHTRANNCLVRLRILAPSPEAVGPDKLEVQIDDDGLGLPDHTQSGIGLTSMRERAAELGGTCVIEPASQGGTRVLAILPIENDNG